MNIVDGEIADNGFKGLLFGFQGDVVRRNFDNKRFLAKIRLVIEQLHK